MFCRELIVHWNSSSDDSRRVFSLLVTFVDIFGMADLTAPAAAAVAAATAPLLGACVAAPPPPLVAGM